jgi:hypothetical protein
MRIILERDDGTTVDVTEGVQVCFDVVVGSMDWGSGFLDTEEVGQVKTLAGALGVDPPYYLYDGTECATCNHYADRHELHWVGLPNLRSERRVCRHGECACILYVKKPTHADEKDS